MKVTKVRVYGLYDSIEASKLPMAVNPNDLNDEVTDMVNKLAEAVIGSGEDNFLNGVIVQFNLTCTLKMWTQLQRYHFMDFVSSQSTMHRITKMPVRDCVNGHADPRILDVLEEKLAEYAHAKGDAAKEAFLNIIYNIPTGFELTARMTTNYRQLKTIYRQRHLHRLPEWREFCEWMKSLPYHEWITGEVSNDDSKD